MDLVSAIIFLIPDLRSNSGLNPRSFLAFVISASVLAMERGKPGESYNIGTGTTTNFNDIYRMVAEVMHSEVQAEYIPNPLKNYQYFTQADITKVRKDLGFDPEFDLRSGIRKMIAATKSI